MADRRPTRGIVVPYYEIVVREVAGYPVVTRYNRGEHSTCTATGAGSEARDDHSHHTEAHDGA